MSWEPEVAVVTLPDYETEIKFPPGPAGLLLEAVVKCGNLAVGARIVAFSPASGQDFFVQGRTRSPYPGSPPASIGALAAEHLNIGSVLTRLDDVCTKHLSFDRIMVCESLQNQGRHT